MEWPITIKWKQIVFIVSCLDLIFHHSNACSSSFHPFPLSFYHSFLPPPPLSISPSDPVEMEYEEAVSKVTLQQIIRDLEPSTSYTFYVKAYTSHGASKPSDSATESTHGEGELKAEPKVPD